MRQYKLEQQNEVHSRTRNGGILYFIKRTDTNQYLHDASLLKLKHTGKEQYTPLTRERDWTDDVKWAALTHGYLTREDAEKELPIIEGCCFMCGNGGKETPCVVIEHKFVPTDREEN